MPGELPGANTPPMLATVLAMVPVPLSTPPSSRKVPPCSVPCTVVVPAVCRTVPSSTLPALMVKVASFTSVPPFTFSATGALPVTSRLPWLVRSPPWPTSRPLSAPPASMRPWLTTAVVILPAPLSTCPVPSVSTGARPMKPP